MVSNNTTFTDKEMLIISQLAYFSFDDEADGWIDNMAELAVQEMSEYSSGNVSDGENLFESSTENSYDELWVSNE